MAYPHLSVKFDLASSELISDGPKDVNEDIASINDMSAWILDGATGLGDRNCTPGESDGKWYVQKFDDYLNSNIDNTSLSLNDIITEGIKTVRDHYNKVCSNEDIDPADLPSSAIAIVRLQSSKIESFVLGDCSVILNRNSDSLERLHDNRVGELDAIVANQMRELVEEQGLDIHQARQELIPLLRKHRRMKNTEEGYWTLGFDPEAPSHGIHQEFPVNRNDSLYLFSDGYSALVDKYNEFESWNSAIEFLEKSGLIEGLRRIRKIEESDNNCVSYPRTKPSDDATGIRAVIQ